MSSDIEKSELPARPEPDLSASSLPAFTLGVSQPSAPDTSLSAAFRHVLGGTPDAPHLPAAALKRGQELAKRSKSEKPGNLSKGKPGKTHIGPRSGHK